MGRGYDPRWMVNRGPPDEHDRICQGGEHTSFSGAARELGISQATASKHVQTLEDWLGVRLLHRTTRRVALTDVGESFFVQCSRILEDMDAARAAAKPEAPVRGSMRITAPVVFGSTRLGPLVVDFLHLHPELSLNVELSDRSVDLIEEGYDLAIRTSPTTGAGLIAWPLMPLDYVALCRAPILPGTVCPPARGSRPTTASPVAGPHRFELAVRWPGRTDRGADLRQATGEQRHVAMRCRARRRRSSALRRVSRGK